jgi:hypothetical protein
MSLKLEHYLPLLQRKHRGLDRAVPVRRWLEAVSPCWRTLLGVLRKREGEVQGSRSFVEVLQMCPTYGTAAVTDAVEGALTHPEVSVGTIRYHLWRHRESQQPPAEPIAVAGPSVQPMVASAYMALCGAGEDHHG